MSKVIAPIDAIEQSVQDTAIWAAELIQQAQQVISPTGRPFFLEEQSLDEQVMEYLQVRGNTPAWDQWIQQRAELITQQLLQSGVTETDLAAIDPVSIATAYAVDWSRRMEEEI